MRQTMGCLNKGSQYCARKAATATPKPLSQMTQRTIPPRLEEIILQCLAKKPAERPESARALSTLLRDVDAKGWTEADAEDWWRKFRDNERPLGASASTLTITVDLDSRREPPLQDEPPEPPAPPPA